MKQILYTNSLKIKHNAPGDYTIILEPLERAFGSTIGFILLKLINESFNGCKVTKVKLILSKNNITDVSCNIPTKENIEELLLNLQKLNFTLKSNMINGKSDYTGSLILRKDSRKIYASDILFDNNNIEVSNPTQFICDYLGRFTLDIVLTISSGIGYITHNAFLEGEHFCLDAIFSPVQYCNFQVEDARVGYVTDYNKLIFTIKANPEVNIKQILTNVLDNFQYQISGLISPIGIPTTPVVEIKGDSILDQDVSVLQLSVRSMNCLRRESLNTIRDLLGKNMNDLIKTPNFGNKSLLEIRNKLIALGYDFQSGDEEQGP